MKPGIDADIILTISGEDYPCMLHTRQGFRKLDLSEFAARVATGPPTYSDSDIYSVVHQEDWRHGLGFPYYSDEYGYAYTGDHVDTRRQGVIQLATKLTSVDASGELVNKFIDYTTDAGAACIAACGATDKGIRWIDDSSWAGKADLDDDSTAREVYDLLDAGNYLLASQDTARLQKMATGADPALDASWSDVGNAGNPPNDFKWLAKGGGYLWGAEDGNNFLHIDGTSDLSAFEGDGETDAACIVVGSETIAITSLQWWNNVMMVGKEDALYQVNPDTLTAKKVWDAPREWSRNFEYMCVGPDGALYFIVYDRVYRWIGRTPIDITPGAWGEFPGGFRALFGVFQSARGGFVPPPTPNYASGERPPYKSYTEFRSMARVGNDIVVCGKTSDSTPEWHMLYWTGSGWHKLYLLTTSSTYVPYAIYRSYNRNKTYVSIGASTTATHAIKHRVGSDLPLDEYPTTGNHYIYFSRISLGLLDISKYLKTQKLRGFNLNTTQTVAWAYEIDDNASYYTLGTQNTSPYQAIDFASTASCRTVQLRANLSTSTATETPFVDAYALKLLARPVAVYGYHLVLRVGDEVQGLNERTIYTPDARTFLTALEAARDSVTPITLNTPLESDVTCFISAYARVGLHYDEKGKPYELVQLSLTVA